MVSKFKKILKKFLPQKIYEFISCWKNGNYSYIYWLFPIKNNKIVISSYFGKGYGDNSKYIVDKLINNNNKYDIVWLINKNLKGASKFPNKVRVVNYGSIKALYELATAKIWIDNCRKILSPPKRKKQFYIQTWHGGIALKKIEKDAESKLDSSYVKFAKRDSKMSDLFISNSKFCTKLYHSAFWYNGKILECGSPRCDILINENNEIAKKVKKHFNIKNETKVLIYAPTFRKDENIKIYDIDFKRLLKAIKEKFGGEWNILIRLHPNISCKSDFMSYTSTIINATDYSDMYELLAASDILVTDYSSTMFEFSLTNKPVILYAPDIKTYIEDRNFYFEIFSLPYPLAQDNDQLIDAVEQFDLYEYQKEINNFSTQLGVFENGDASNQVVKIIKHILDN